MKDKYRSILLFGPPGAGKGTLGGFLSAVGKHYHLSSGDIFRGIDPESEMGQLCRSYYSQGNLIPDDLTIEIWRRYTEGLVATNRYFPTKQLLLLDGIPRTLAQAKILGEHIDVAAVIVLEMPNIEVLIKRLQKRALIEKRHDDTDETVLYNRMQVYEKETKELLSWYPEKTIHRFNADMKPLEVLRDVLNKLSPLLS